MKTSHFFWANLHNTVFAKISKLFIFWKSADKTNPLPTAQVLIILFIWEFELMQRPVFIIRSIIYLLFALSFQWIELISHSVVYFYIGFWYRQTDKQTKNTCFCRTFHTFLCSFYDRIIWFQQNPAKENPFWHALQILCKNRWR